MLNHGDRTLMIFIFYFSFQNIAFANCRHVGATVHYLFFSNTCLNSFKQSTINNTRF
ncbi:hypothetical protein WN944_020589 [Citrus x changshan-huyou]|uniref:Uncharacterized protein n=1 Tax=Citrus x changshan-huyou TaxID=2935761 RepID=A0AAP0QGZ0_9ROSI